MKKGIIKKVEIFDHEKLTILVKKSKAYWGYTPSQIEEWNDELTITPDYISSNDVLKLSIDKNIVGCYSYLKVDKNVIQLDFFFISPDYIGMGYGKILMHHFLKRIQKEKFKTVVVKSDPNAENFYTHFGFKTINKIESNIKGRYLPTMQKDI